MEGTEWRDGDGLSGEGRTEGDGMSGRKAERSEGVSDDGGSEGEE